MAVVQAVTGLVRNASALALFVGPIVEETTLKPALKYAHTAGEETAAKANIRTYSQIAHTGLAGILAGNILNMLLDKKRRTGSKGYKKWARLGDLFVFGIIATGGATRMYTKKLKDVTPGSAEAASAEKGLALVTKLTPVLSFLVLFANWRKGKNAKAAK